MPPSTQPPATLSGAINGGFNLTKSGASTLTLTGTNTYTGSTTINGGTLSVAGDSNLGAGTINLGAGNSTLAATGSGTIDNNLSLTGSATLQVASDLTWSGIISGNNPLNKTGAGTLTLSATNTATGATTVSAGSLLVTGSIVSATNVSSGATLGGTGTVGNIVTVQNGGTLAPGASGVNGGIGRLTINGGLDMQSGSTLAIQINGTDAGDDYDQLMVSGAVNVSDAILAPSHSYVSHNGDEYTIIDNDGVEGIYGIFAGVAQAGTVTAGGNGSALTANYSGGDGNDFTLIAPINSTPVVNNLGGSIAYTAGATVLLDSGADVEVTDVEDDVANWNGGSLVVQRTFGGVADPTANDIFGFASGMAIEVDDNSLKSSALTFATFTNTGGVLTINFTGTDTDVTADFIEQLIQNITYRNDTPYGDATIRFSLTDSGGRTTHSDVILTSSSIYVDSTHDDGDGDAADGFSLREALDRSLAQASADTIYVVLPDNSTITFGVGAVSGAGDTLDFSSARGLTVTGSTLTLDGALTINTGSSDVTLGSNLVGTATLTKVGTGTLTLTNTDNEALFSGDMALNGGTLAVGADNSLSSGNLQFDGGTLRISTGGTVIDNAMSFGNGGGTLHADVDWTASGVFSGSGQLNKTGFFGILTLSGTSGHTGVTSIAEGMLAVGGDENLGTGILELNGGAFSVNTTGKTIDNNINVTSHTGIIQIDLGLEATLSGLISGTSEILKNGGGKLNLTNSGNSATSWSLRQINGTTAIASADMIGSGNLRLMGGTLEVNATSDSIFSQAVHVTGATTINADGSNSSVILTFSGAMTGSGALSLNAGDSTLTFTNSANRSSFAGNIDVVTGTLAVANSDALSDGVISLAHDTHMRIGGANGVVSNDIIVKGYVYLTTEAAVSSDGITFTGDITENSLGNMITLNANATNRIIFSNNTTNVFITSLQSGTLVLAGAEFDQNLVTDSGTRLEGSGDIFNLLVSGTLAPGADGSAGRINANNDLTFLAGAKIEVDLGGPVAAIDYDQIAAYGTMSLSGAQVIINSNAYIPQPGDRFMFIDHASGNMYIPFANLQQGDTYTHNGRVMYFTYQGGDGDDIGFVANTAPSVDTTAALALNPVQEDAPAPTNGSTTHATLVHDLIGTSMTDPDTTARGIAITGISDQGTLYYSTNSGSTWTAVTSELSDTSALLLAADVFTWLYFQPHANEDGTIPDAIRFRAWDLSTGTVNTYADVSTNGGSTAFSAATAQISIHVDPINDAPTITAPGSIPIMEDIPGAITGISFTDVDAGSSPVTVNLSVPAGTLAATSGSGVTVSGNGSVMTLEGSVADINAFIAAGQVTYTTALNEFTNVALTVGISDNGNTGSGGALSDTVTVMLDVSAINDAPENSIPAPQQVEHNGTLVFNAANGNAISIRDVDAGSSEVEVTLTATNGLISLGSTSGLNFVVGSGLGETTMTFSGSISDINIALANLVFTPARNYHGAATIEITTNDMGWSGNGGAQRDTDIIGITVERPDSPVHVDTPTAPQAPIRPSAPAPVPTIGTSAPMIVLAPANSDSALSGVLISVEAPALISSAIPPIPSVVATGLPSLAQLTAPGYASSVHVQPGVESVAASLPSFTADTRGAAGTGTAITAAASAFIDRSTMNAEIQLQAQRDIGSFNLQPGAPVYIALPENTFSADASSQLTIEARQGNGAPLPSWLRFDPVTGTFTGKVPTGFHGALTIEIIIRDSKDNLASSRLQLIIGAPTSLLTPMDLDELFTTQNSPAAKADLASQFAQFGRAAWDAEANALLTRLQAARS